MPADTTQSLLALAGQTDPVIIIGAGPAGLSAAYELTKSGVKPLILEATGTIGGISQTAEYKGYLFDIGGHRFFTKVELVNQMWREILGDDFLQRPRMSRILYSGKFFNYPLEPMNALLGLGPLEAIHCGLSYARAMLSPMKPEEDFATWVSNRFGRRLFKIFFESYTEKVWGMPCSKISAEWGAQRIKGLSLWSAVLNAFRSKRAPKDKVIKTLIHEFEYPRRGPGMMWERARQIVESRGARVVLNSPVTKIVWEQGRVRGVEAGGQFYSGSHVISSMPIRDLIRSLDPQPEPRIHAAAGDFNYRDFLTVALIIKAETLFPDNWIYIHDTRVKVGRIQNYKNWSPEMTPDPGMTCLGLEYFCFEGDDLWTKPDADLVALGTEEVVRLGLARKEQIVDGTVVRMPKAYPVYDGGYKRGIAAIQEFLQQVPNLQLAGRNGMHRYNNQDHSMLTAVLAARNILGANYDLWQVNADAEYHESGAQTTEEDFKQLERTQPLVPGELVAK
ncbi:MAG TPA: NAD(P)/FAD-dependent oxidoreductase [Bryobacteraceae bacterium]|nr:NAD(P)/FAD-dependent oxidoreductase [Bryobacteraceae bacterium]